MVGVTCPIQSDTFFIENVIFQIGVPNNRPVIAYAWSTANIDATLIV